MLGAIFFIVAGLVVFVLIIAVLPIRCTLQFMRTGHDDEGIVTISLLFGLIKIRHQLLKIQPKVTHHGPSLHVDGHKNGNHATEHFSLEEIFNFIENIPQWSHFARVCLKELKPVLRRIKILTFHFKVAIGLENAMYTGVLTGFSWTVLSLVTGEMSKMFRLMVKPKIQVEPVYHRNSLELSAKGIFSISTGHAIVAAIRFFFVWRRMKSSWSIPFKD
ncbi:DUF2953 domain-containing protein [Alicyclobacillus sp. TC]|uniref:DUF2953 domain-containing protein n=1 Tax=Alicyclobacillus sp. TC TaxID=2606450 RepID=UPI0019333C89|nr:DUF2953 domain-containing protein [Alicyclobacillus sp. TC]QRF23302.1 DUF2953 domain-containing protein [Alicyclobacillus sp. TC]